MATNHSASSSPLGKKTSSRIIGLCLVIIGGSAFWYFYSSDSKNESTAQVVASERRTVSRSEPASPPPPPVNLCGKKNGPRGYCAGTVVVEPGQAPVKVYMPGGHCMEWSSVYNDKVDIKSGIKEDLKPFDPSMGPNPGTLIQFGPMEGSTETYEIDFEIDRRESELCLTTK